MPLLLVFQLLLQFYANFFQLFLIHWLLVIFDFEAAVLDILLLLEVFVLVFVAHDVVFLPA